MNIVISLFGMAMMLGGAALAIRLSMTLPLRPLAKKLGGKVTGSFFGGYRVAFSRSGMEHLVETLAPMGAGPPLLAAAVIGVPGPGFQIVRPDLADVADGAGLGRVRSGAAEIDGKYVTLARAPEDLAFLKDPAVINAIEQILNRGFFTVLLKECELRATLSGHVDTDLAPDNIGEVVRHLDVIAAALRERAVR